MGSKTVQRRQHRLPRPECIRRIRGSFAWIDHRLLRDGHLARLGLEDMALYLFLLLAADRDGISYYRKERICAVLGLSWAQFEVARGRLIDHGLIAFAPFRRGDVNGFYQVLPLPEGNGA